MSKRQTPCPTGKLGHDTAEGARDQLASLKRNGKCRDRDDLGVYRCLKCGRWHVGHRIGCRGRKTG